MLALSTHATFDSRRPHFSHFVLADRSARVSPRNSAPLLLDALPDRTGRLNLDDIRRGNLALKPGVIVVAEACETGQIERGDTIEEFVGFPAAFLAAGASSVVASLWPVDDVSTWLLMSAFYHHLFDGEASPAAALQAAARDVREMRRDEILARIEAETAFVANLRAEAERVGDDSAYVAAAGLLHRLRVQGRRLRQLPSAECPFADPYYWAAFTVHGGR